MKILKKSWSLSLLALRFVGEIIKKKKKYSIETSLDTPDYYKEPKQKTSDVAFSCIKMKTKWKQIEVERKVEETQYGQE